MKNRLSFLALGFAGIFALLPGCGEDEGTGDEATGGGSGGSSGSGGGEGCRIDDDCSENRLCIGLRGNMDDYCDEGETCICVGGGEGGTGGTTGGSSGKGGSSGATLGGSGGKGGTGGTPATTTLGEPCASDDDCEGLTCLLPDGLPSGDGPPNGLCTETCTTDDACLELAASAYCVVFEGDPAMMTAIQLLHSGLYRRHARRTEVRDARRLRVQHSRYDPDDGMPASTRTTAASTRCASRTFARTW